MCFNWYNLSTNFLLLFAGCCIRYQLNVKKNKVDDYHLRKPVLYSSQQLSAYLSDTFIAEDFIDPIQPLSKSVISSSANTYKTRVLNFLRTDHGYQGLLLGLTNLESVFFYLPQMFYLLTV